MNQNKIKVIMIGIEHAHAEGVMQELLAQSDTFEVIGYVENKKSVIEQKANKEPFNKLRRLLEEDVLVKKKYSVDALVIETGMSELVKTAKKYLALNVALHIDKPTGIDDDFLVFLDNAKKRNIPIQLGYMYRYNPAIFVAKDYIRNHKIGDISYIHAFMDTELNVNERSMLNRYPGGAMYVYGCHMIDIILDIMKTPKKIYPFIKQTGFNNLKTNDNTILLLEYENGISIAAANCADANGYGRRQIVISGSSGSLEIKPLENPTRMSYAARDGKNAYQDKAVSVDLSKYILSRRYYYMIKDFAKLTRRDFQKLIFPLDYEYEKTLHKILMKAVH